MAYKIYETLTVSNFNKIAIIFINIYVMFNIITPSFAENTIAPPMIRANITVKNDNILLGDIFINLKRHSNKPIAKSPKLGESITLPAKWLWKIAKIYNVDWKPTSKLDISIVNRESIIIDEKTINDTIRNALFEYTGDDELMDIAFNANLPEMHIPIDSDYSVKIKRLRYDKITNRFSIEMIAPATGNIESSAIITGRIHKMIEVALPNRRIMAGEVIKRRDLNWTKIRAKKINRRALLDSSQIIGKAAKRTLISGKAILQNSIEPPILVKKNSLVVITLNTKNMRITTQGKAIHNGSMQENIQIRNLKSNRIIEAIVTGAGKAMIVNYNELAMN